MYVTIITRKKRSSHTTSIYNLKQQNIKQANNFFPTVLYQICFGQNVYGGWHNNSNGIVNAFLDLCEHLIFLIEVTY